MNMGNIATLLKSAFGFVDKQYLEANPPEVDLSDYAEISYVDSLVSGVLRDRGNYDASGNTFPASGGSGSAGAIKKGDLWYISVAGTLGSAAVGVGDTVRALADTPGQTAGNWAVMENNLGYVPERSIDAASSKTTPVDADTVGFIDSAASNVLKKVSWANIKATLKAYFDTLYTSSAIGSFTATGGTITTDGAYTIHTFTSSGTLSVSGGGTREVEYLVVAGGGGGGASNGGGGGGGGIRAGKKLVKGNQFVVVGAGGNGGVWNGSPNGSPGGLSAIYANDGDVVSIGGGAGRGEINNTAPAVGSSGGGGGGSGTGAQTAIGGTLGQGYSGGNGLDSGSAYAGGGGGGATAVGAAAGANTGGNGGAGFTSSISGSSVTYAGGGGGGVYNSGGTAGTGQAGGGTGGKGIGSVGSAATANTGSGGGGGGNASSGGNGGSGIVILRYLT
jgi:hypothetical protein